ncbi:MAG: hypothetical protein H3C35_06495 [Bacteroidetes bacterium]|nr:hypothetical protein [Bacteroidota bacterium]
MKYFILSLIGFITLTEAQTVEKSKIELKNKYEVLSFVQHQESSTDNYYSLKSLIEENVSYKKSASTAVIYSLLLPGMGELYADGFDDGKYSLISEGVLWFTYYGFQQYGNWIQTDARNFASVHAGAILSGKNEAYFVNIGNFQDTYEYNEKKLQDRDITKVYQTNNDYFWKWDSEVNRQRYREMRVSSDIVFNNGKFVIGAIIVNHIISAVNAARLVRIYNNKANETMGTWWLESSLHNRGALPDGITLSLVHRF